MAYGTTHQTVPAFPQRRGLSVRALSLFMLWVAMASSGFVLYEPAPYDLLMASLIMILPLSGGAALNPRLSVFLLLWLIVTAGASVATSQAGLMAVPGRHIAITAFLSLTAVVVACAVYRDPRRVTNLILSGMTVAALVSVVLACLGYFDIVPGAQELFTKFDRAKAAFKDPNVFGAFLVPVLVYTLHRVANARLAPAIVQLVFAGMISLCILISFSRGAWVQAAVSVLTYAAVAFLASRTDTFRLRLFVVMVLGAAGAVLGLLALSQIDAVADLLNKRASLSLGYDIGSQGRFGGHLKALDLISRYPAGIGALEFARSHHHEDVHNVYLSMFLNSGWIGGFAYLGLVMATLATGFVHSFRRTPHQGLMVVMFASFAGAAVEGLIIDSDHWRHYYILMGVVWGLAASGGFAREPRRKAWSI